MTTKSASRTADVRAQLSRSAVIERAFAIADTVGLPAVSIRRLAAELGVTPMALYWHVKNKDELLEAMGDAVIASVELSHDDSAPWDDRLRLIMTRLVSALRAHPSLAYLAATRVMTSEHGFELTEQALALLRSAEFTVAQSANLAQQALHTAITLCSAEPGHEYGIADDELVAKKHAMLATLPPDRFPNLIEAADDLTGCADEDFYYNAGIDLFIAGVQGLHRKIAR